MPEATVAAVPVLNGLVLECPRCGDKEQLFQNQIVPAVQHVKQVDGELEWGSTEVLYEYDEIPKDEPEFFCRCCDLGFEAPEFSTKSYEKEAV